MRKLFLVVTAACNFTCSYCYRFIPKSRKSEITGDDVKKLIEDAFDCGFRGLVLTGGEPLLRSDIFSIIDMSKNIGYSDISINTNGGLIDDCMARKINSSGLNAVNISLDSSSKEYNDNIGRDFDKVVSGIRSMASVSERRVKIRVTMVITNRNFREIRKSMKFLRKLGVDDFFVQPVSVNKNHEQKDLSLESLSKDDLADFMAEMRKIARLLSQEEYIQLILDYYSGNRVGISRCTPYINTVMVESDGGVYNCFGKSMEILGNIRKEALADILDRKNDSSMKQAKCINSKCLCFFKSAVRGLYD